MGPLAGVRVIELAGLGAAPYVGMMLADMGADVVRVERKPPPPAIPDVLARGRRSIVLDDGLTEQNPDDVHYPGGEGTVPPGTDERQLVTDFDLEVPRHRSADHDRLGR